VNITTIEDAIYNVLSLIAAPVPMVCVNPNAPTPGLNGEVVVMQHNAFKKLGIDGFKSTPVEVDDDHDVVVTTDTEFVLMLIGHGSSGRQAIYSIYDALQLPGIRRSFYAAGLAYIDHEPTQDLTLEFNSQLESRVGLDLKFRVANRVTYQTEVIEHVNLNLLAKEGSRTVVDTIINVENDL
jgi:hypothetical protein